MIRRVERIVANVMRERAAAMSDAIVWAGTFHAVGARLLREGRAQERLAYVLTRMREDGVLAQETPSRGCLRCRRSWPTNVRAPTSTFILSIRSKQQRPAFVLDMR